MRALSTRKFLIGGLAALSFVLAGCLTDSEDKGPKITSQPMSQTLAVGDTLTLSVTATGNGTLSYKWYATIGGDLDTLSDTTATIKTTVDISLDGATIYCVVTDKDGSKTSKTATLTITGTAWGVDKIDSLGAQANATLGSVIDLDSGKVWSSVTANANQAKIDLVYLYYGGVGDSAASLNGAKAARDSGVKYGINLTNTYNALQVKDIMLVKVSAKPASQHHAKMAYDDGAKVASVRIVAGDKFVVKSSENKYMYIEVTSVTGARTGSAKVTFNIGTI